MPGLSDYAATANLDWVTARAPMPSLGSRFLALFTAAPTSDAGTGGTEVTGGAYARVQVAGLITAAGAISTGSNAITMPNVSGNLWVVAGMNVYSITAGKQIGTVLSYVGTTLTLTGNASNNGSGSTDSLAFSMWPAASAGGAAASSVANAGVITFAAATANWGTVVAWGIYDALTTGNLVEWDYLGNYAWNPCSISSASPGVMTVKANGYSVADSVVFSVEYGGTAPSFSQSNLTGILAVAHQATDTIDVTNAATAVNTSSTGSGMVRKITQQSIPSGVTASFAANAITLTSA